ncbi:MAG: SGNH/GDSL hydrolase family protein [Acidimicrobiales bacterium]|nr:SGNH/GDSL hydrolase family protein [Acidimicrobiales bacterium]
MRDVRGKVKLAAVVACCALLAACGYVDRVTKQPVTKVLLVGDSMMWGAAPEIMDEFQSRGLEARYIGLAATGPLWNNKLWATWTQQAINEFDPDLVILEGCCVYPGPATAAYGGGQLYTNGAGQTAQPDSELMFAEWEQAARELVTIARSGGASVWWANVPRGLEPARYYGALFPERINRLRQMYKTIGVPVVDWDTAIYSQPSPMSYRAGDGVHPNAAGYDLIGRYTFDATVEPAPEPTS